MILFREHRGAYAESMATQVELADYHALLVHVAKLLQAWGPIPLGTRLNVEPYSKDDRDSRWADTFVVTVPGYGVVGFVNAEVHSLSASGERARVARPNLLFADARIFPVPPAAVDVMPCGTGSLCEPGSAHEFNMRYRAAGFIYEICPHCGCVRITEDR